MFQIDWAGFTWQAFATLATGGMAFTAALIIGFRQVEIAHRQSEIAAQQAQTARMAQREKLFDRRYAIYSKLVAFEDGTFGVEELAEGEDRAPDIRALLLIAQLLFSEEIYTTIEEILNELHGREAGRKGLQYLKGDAAWEQLKKTNAHGEKAFYLTKRLKIMMADEMRLFDIS